MDNVNDYLIRYSTKFKDKPALENLERFPFFYRAVNNYTIPRSNNYHMIRLSYINPKLALYGVPTIHLRKTLIKLGLLAADAIMKNIVHNL